jgi:hypothetical protein
LPAFAARGVQRRRPARPASAEPLASPRAIARRAGLDMMFTAGEPAWPSTAGRGPLRTDVRLEHGTRPPAGHVPRPSNGLRSPQRRPRGVLPHRGCVHDVQSGNARPNRRARPITCTMPARGIAPGLNGTRARPRAGGRLARAAHLAVLAGARGAQGRVSLRPRGPVAQWQSEGLLIPASWVRIPAGSRPSCARHSSAASLDVSIITMSCRRSRARLLPSRAAPGCGEDDQVPRS